MEATQQGIQLKWYALRCFTGHENKVKAYIEDEMKRRGLSDRVVEVVIPNEKVYEVREGKKRIKTKSFLPGYILLEAALDKKLIDIILSIPSVVSFVGPSKDRPTALQPDEMRRILGKVEEKKNLETPEVRCQPHAPESGKSGPATAAFCWAGSFLPFSSLFMSGGHWRRKFSPMSIGTANGGVTWTGCCSKSLRSCPSRSSPAPTSKQTC